MSRNLTCSGCRKKQMQLVTDRYRAEIKHDGRTYTADIPKLAFYRCPECKDSIILPDESDERVGLELRRVADLLQPEEIKAIRVRHGLTQQQFAQLLEIGEATVCRWEKGTQIQQRAFDKMLRAFNLVPEFRHFLQGRTAKSVQTVTQNAAIIIVAPVPPQNDDYNRGPVYRPAAGVRFFPESQISPIG